MNNSNNESFVMQVERKRKRAQHLQVYQVLASVPPTSNMMILFLRVNTTYWDVRTVDSVI
ncbi:hypothetical protein F441_12172 [Phytophthora nicotianae CJ01A1]|uniref:Uncharacterized protein n=2 Tax=Phytophthora nicotianae TaxID=4792 RepID=W2WPM6_PHYNI|nr:hypothetical protein L915_21891 [Phytophthora nicotianae]ETP12476.1 hypothetical protein F441_12172 [Phytophthora nicotianae CJ01A1]